MLMWKPTGRIRHLAARPALSAIAPGRSKSPTLGLKTFLDILEIPKPKKTFLAVWTLKLVENLNLRQLCTKMILFGGISFKRKLLKGFISTFRNQKFRKFAFFNPG